MGLRTIVDDCQAALEKVPNLSFRQVFLFCLFSEVASHDRDAMLTVTKKLSFISSLKGAVQHVNQN